MDDTKKPGVLHIDTERTWRGGQQQAAWLLEGLLARGWPTALVCPPRSILEERGRARSWPVHPVAMHGELDVAAGHRIARIARDGGLAILHAHSSHALALGLWARFFDRGLRLVASRRVDFPIRRHFLSRLKYSSGVLDRIICISAAVRAQLVADGVPADKLVVIPSGVDTRRFAGVRPPPHLRRSLGIPGSHLVIGTVAALADHKDYPTLLRAARLVLDQEPDISFVAVGDGPLHKEIAALARELGLGKRFLLLGFREDVGCLLKVFDIFVLASKTEGLGTSLLDAQALGLPVAACRAGGIPEIVTDRETGLLVPPVDPPALAAALLELAHNPELCARLGAQAKKAVQEHDVSRTVDAHLKLYRSLTGC
ncbi:MAG: glycosyltransferase [Candidatus Methylomirabilia bacterium]